jgi:hypothetical protein
MMQNYFRVKKEIVELIVNEIEVLLNTPSQDSNLE